MTAENSHLAILEKMYRLYDRTLERIMTTPAACGEKCADCCTCNVTATGLEALFLVRTLGPDALTDLKERLSRRFPAQRYQPALTFNAFAEACITGRDLPGEENDPGWGRCPLLADGLCCVYGGRPFGCRCMVSENRCAETGTADMPPLVLTVNNLFLQYIEQLDYQGVSGNLSDVLRLVLGLTADPACLSPADFRFENLINSDTTTGKTTGIVPNMRIPALLVPPEHRSQVGPLLKQLAALVPA